MQAVPARHEMARELAPAAVTTLSKALLHIGLRILARRIQDRCGCGRPYLGGFDSLALPPPISWALKAQPLRPPEFAVIHPWGDSGTPGLRLGH